MSSDEVNIHIQYLRFCQKPHTTNDILCYRTGRKTTYHIPIVYSSICSSDSSSHRQNKWTPEPSASSNSHQNHRSRLPFGAPSKPHPVPLHAPLNCRTFPIWKFQHPGVDHQRCHRCPKLAHRARNHPSIAALNSTPRSSALVLSFLQFTSKRWRACGYTWYKRAGRVTFPRVAEA
jgi:hypothetical protein